MGRAEQLLESLDLGDETLYPISPEEESHVVIDSSRRITVPSSLKRIAVQYDCDVESITFDCPRYWDGLDLLKFKMFINYMRGDNELGSYYIDDAKVSPIDENMINFTWTIGGHIAEVPGNIRFLVCAKRTGTQGNTENCWNTELNTECSVSDGMSTNQNTIYIYPDLVTQILSRLASTATYVPHVSEDGIVSWTNDQGLPNPEPIDITGPRGEKGDTGYGLCTLITSLSYTQGDIEKYSSNSYSGTWTVNSSDGVKIGDTVLLRVTNTTKTGYSYIVAKVTKIPSSTSVVCTSMGLIDKGEVGPRGEKGDLTSNIVASFAMQRNKRVYTIKFPLWETSQTSSGEKLDDNETLICIPSTAVEHAQNDYENIPLFRTYDCNAHVTDDGIRLIDAIAGDSGFNDTGKNDVFVLGMSYYEKSWIEDGYWYYSRTALPKEDYTLAKECMTPDGRDQGFAVYGKYVCGLLDGILYSSKGLAPARYLSGGGTSGRYLSYSNNISEFKKKGKRYTGGLMCDYKYIITTFWLMFGTINSQSVMAGVTNWSAQHKNLVALDNTDRIILTNSQANTYDIGCSVSIGDNENASSAPDRNIWKCHNLAECVTVLGKEKVDDNNTAVIVDAIFNSTLTTWISTFHYRSGFSDNVKGRTGCPCFTKSELTNGKYPIVFQGIEMMVGGYEIGSNVILDIADGSGISRDVYVTDDATKLSSTIETVRKTYAKLSESITVSKTNSWNYVTAMFLDLVNGAIIPTKSGLTNSGSNTGFADAVYADAATSGQREWRFFGGLWCGAVGGLSCLVADYGLSDAGWYVLSRLSINAVG
ncbi:hypothetical protein DW790_05910 [Firmicutes bacterium AM31-12AC]|nr:hypothetical protein DW790_05910 [Firmicutes bacterium AM31-12AC]